MIVDNGQGKRVSQAEETAGAKVGRWEAASYTRNLGSGAALKAVKISTFTWDVKRGSVCLVLKACSKVRPAQEVVRKKSWGKVMKGPWSKFSSFIFAKSR